MNQPSTPPTLEAQTWNAYSANLPRHLIGLARYLQSRLMHTLIEECGHSNLGLQFEPYISLAGDNGIRLSQLAETLAISKQAVNQTVNQIEKAGYLRRVPDPEDGRAKRAVLTRQGRQLLSDGARLLGAVEHEFRGIIGAGKLTRFSDQLGDLYSGLGFEAPFNNEGSSALGWLLPRFSDKLMQELMELTRSKGHPGLKMSYAQVLTLMSPAGGRIQEMARINEVSKQAISAIARELEDQGYLQRVPDPADARQVILGFTPAGVRLIEDSIAATRKFNQRFSRVIGPEKLVFIKETAATLYEDLGLENEIFGRRSADTNESASDIVHSLGMRKARQLAMRLIELTETHK